MKTVLKIFVAASLIGLVNSSCKKDLEDGFSTDQLVAVDQNQADNEADDVGNIEDQTLEANTAALGTGRIAVNDTVLTENCATVTITPKGSNPTGTITIDFKNGCMCKDDRMRKGKIISKFTNRLRVPGAEITTSFDGYGVTRKGGSEYVLFDNSSTKTTKTVDAPATITDGAVLRIDREVNMKLVLPGGSNFSYSGIRQMVWNLGQLANRWDNVYTTKKGSTQSGVDRKGRNYTMTVDTDVVRKAECAFLGIYKPVSGQITIQHDTKTKVVNYGDGACDNSVDVTINGRKTRTRW